MERITEADLLRYLDNDSWWKAWQMEGVPEPKQAAALLANWMSGFEVSSPHLSTHFWTLRTAMFYTGVRFAHHWVHGGWKEPAEYVEWDEFLAKAGTLPQEEGVMFIPGKFRTLPTPNQIASVEIGLKYNSRDRKPLSALIFEPKENIVALEGEKIVFDDRIRAWACSLLPVDIVTRFPVIQEGEMVDEFYADRYAQIRRAVSGWAGVDVGLSEHRKKIIDSCREAGIEIVDTSIHDMGTETTMFKTTSGLDEISRNADLAEQLILIYLQKMGQI